MSKKSIRKKKDTPARARATAELESASSSCLSYSELYLQASTRNFLSAVSILDYLGGKKAAKKIYMTSYEALSYTLAGQEPRAKEVAALRKLLLACWEIDPDTGKLNDRFLRQIGLTLKIYRAPIIGTIVARPGIAVLKEQKTAGRPIKVLDEEKTQAASPYVDVPEERIMGDLRERARDLKLELEMYEKWISKGLSTEGEMVEDVGEKQKELNKRILYAKDELERKRNPILIRAEMITPAAIAVVVGKSPRTRKVILSGQPWVNEGHRTGFSRMEIGMILHQAYGVAPELQAYWRKLRDSRPPLSIKQRRQKMVERFPGLQGSEIRQSFGGTHRTAVDRVAELVTASIVGLKPEGVRRNYRSELRKLRNLPSLQPPSSR